MQKTPVTTSPEQLNEKSIERSSDNPLPKPVPGGPHTDVTKNKDWISSRLGKTLLHIRAGNRWDNIVAVELGSSRNVNDFLAMVSRNLEVSRIGHLSVLLPSGLAKPGTYVVELEWGKQDTFLVLLDMLKKAIVRLGVTRPVRYVLTGTASVGAWVSI